MRLVKRTCYYCEREPIVSREGRLLCPVHARVRDLSMFGTSLVFVLLASSGWTAAGITLYHGDLPTAASLAIVGIGATVLAVLAWRAAWKD